MAISANEIRELLRGGDSFAAIESIQRQGAPVEIAASYQSLVRDLYWKARDLPALIVIGRAGVLYCLGQRLLAGLAPETIEKLGSAAKGLAYNIGSFTWPGWEEPGISPTPDDVAVGRDCAKLNLRLALDLHKPPAGVSAAHWLVGAHALAARDFEVAEKEFQLAQEVLPVSDKSAQELDLCNLGYQAVARLGGNAADAAAQARFAEITAQLAERQDDDSREYLAQLIRARRLFVPEESRSAPGQRPLA